MLVKTYLYTKHFKSAYCVNDFLKQKCLDL